MSSERRSFLSFLCLKAPLTVFGFFSLLSCEAESDSEGKPLYLPTNNTDYHNDQSSTPGNSKPNSQSNTTASRPQRVDSSANQPKISVLGDLKNRVGNAQIEITYDEDGDPYVKSISGVGSECLYFTVNGKQYLGDEIHVANVFIDLNNDVVEWYCNGEHIDI